MDSQADPYATRLHRGIDLLLIFTTLLVLALFIGTARRSSSPVPAPQPSVSTSATEPALVAQR